MDFLGVLGKVFIDGDAPEDPNADDYDGNPEVEEVQDGVRLVKVLDDLNLNRDCRGRVDFQGHFLGQSLVGVQSYLMTESLESLVELHEFGQGNRPRGGRDRCCLSDFNRGLAFDAGEHLGVV